jgi:hypothetical protein
MEACVESLFDTADGALKFAYRFTTEQYDRPLMNRLADKVKRTGKGLVGVDGAGQSGMIRREVQSLGRFVEAIVTARYAPRTTPCACGAACCSGEKLNPEWADAIGFITTEAVSRLSGKLTHYRLRRGIVERQFGVKHKIGDLADACGVNRDTASEHNSIITTWLAGEKRTIPNAKVGEIARAIAMAEGRLNNAGLVG